MTNRAEINHEYYQSPYSWKYGSEEMRKIWSLKNFWLKWRDVAIAVAETQMKAGIVSPEELNDLVIHRDDIDINEILRREKDKSHPKWTGHDVAAAISEFGDKATKGARIIYQGMTSEDGLSNAEPLQIKESFELIEKKLENALIAFSKPIEEYKGLVCLGYTHLQAAEPTTLGYRFARYAQDFITDLNYIRTAKQEIKGKGIKGAVGTSASFGNLLKDTEMTSREHEREIMKKLDLDPVIIAGQTYPRKFTLLTLLTLSLIAQSAHQFATDLKLLQSSPFDELSEPRGKNQIGSAAMPHKRNPVGLEKIKSLSRAIIGKTVEAWINASEITLERGLEDSAGKRSYLPEAFLAIDEILLTTEKIVKGLEIRKNSIERNFDMFAPFMSMEIILAELCKKGANRQKMHELLRDKVQEALDDVRRGKPNPLGMLVLKDEAIEHYLDPQEIGKVFDSVRGHIGDAPQRCSEFLRKKLYPAIKNSS